MNLGQKIKTNLDVVIFTIAAIMMASPFIIFAVQKILGEK